MRSPAFEICVNADLECEIAGRPFSITAYPGRIVINTSNLASCLSLVRHRPARGKLRSDLAYLNLLLNEFQSTLEIHIRDVCVATIGFGVHSSLESLFGLDQCELRPVAIMRSAIHSW
jgi:hypothetical protein